MHERYASFARLGGAQVVVTSAYPAWQPDFESTLLDVVRAAHVEVYGHEPHVTAVHAGLEAGEIAAHLPGLVAVIVGPTVEGAHSPQERLDVASVGPLLRRGTADPCAARSDERLSVAVSGLGIRARVGFVGPVPVRMW